MRNLRGFCGGVTHQNGAACAGKALSLVPGMLRQILVKLVCCFILLAAYSFAAGTAAFQLGVNYSEWLPFPANNGPQLVTDAFGAAYFLSSTLQNNVQLSTVTKLGPDGKTVVWRNQIGFGASEITVDPMGGVYVATTRVRSDTPAYIAKLSASGTGIAWQISVGFFPQSPVAIAADSQGRVYFAAASNVLARNANVGRINGSGTAIDFTTTITAMQPSSIAVDSSGAAYVSGTSENAQATTIGFVAKVSSDGSAGYYTTLPAAYSGNVAVDANGNAAVFAFGAFLRIDAGGVVTHTMPLTAPAVAFGLDAAGNAYIAEVTNRLYHARNSVASCAFDPATTLSSYSQLLQVIDPGGSTIQATYLPGGNNLGAVALAVTPSGTVLMAATAGPGFTPTQNGPFPAGITGGMFLSNLSPASLSPASGNSQSPTVSLTCAGSSASLMLGSISPGELVSLFGNGLGPQEGLPVQDTPPFAFPTRAANVQVTFDGIPAPLLYVQDAQLNVVVPWSIAPGRNTRICAIYNNVTTNCLMLPVVAATPAVFTVDGQFAAALNQDSSYNTADNPAAPGSIVSVYATGLGPITPVQIDGAPIGLPLPTNNFAFGVQAVYTIGIPFGIEEDVPFDVQYAGPAPTLVAGVSQINFRVERFPSYGTIYLHMGSTNSPGFSLHIAGQ